MATIRVFYPAGEPVDLPEDTPASAYPVTPENPQRLSEMRSCASALVCVGGVMWVWVRVESWQEEAERLRDRLTVLRTWAEEQAGAAAAEHRRRLHEGGAGTAEVARADGRAQAFGEVVARMKVE